VEEREREESLEDEETLVLKVSLDEEEVLVHRY